MELIDVTSYNRHYLNDMAGNWVTPVMMASCYVIGASSTSEPKASSALFINWPNAEEREGYHETNRS